MKTNIINTFLIKYQEKLLIVLTVLLMLVGIITSYALIEIYPSSNDECLWIEKRTERDSSRIFIVQIKEGGVTDNAGIKENDILLAINNIPLKNTMIAMQILNKMHSGDFAKYTIQREDKIFSTKVYIKKLINFGDLSFTLMSMCWLFVGFVVIMAKKNGLVQKIFFKIGVALILFMLQIFFMYTVLADLSLTLSPLFYIRFLSLLGVFYFPFLMIQFFWNFPKPFNFANKKWIKHIFLWLPLLLTVIAFAYEAITVRMGRAEYISALRITGGVSSLALYSGYSIGFIFLIINFFRLKEKQERKSVIFIAVSYFLGIASNIYILFFAPVLAGIIFNHPEYYTPIILVILLPVSFGYSIFKYQLMDVSTVVKNTATYLLATVGLALIYFVTIYLLGQSISTALGTPYQGLIAGIIFVIFAFFFQSTKDKFQEILTKRFYPEQFAYQQILLKFSNDLPTIIGLDKILQSMQKTFVDSLKLNKFGLILFDDNSNEISFNNCLNINCNDVRTLKAPQKLFDTLNQKRVLIKQFVVEQTDFSNIFDSDANTLIKEGVYTVIPMFIKDKVIGLILLGLKSSGSQFGGKDFELLTAIASQAAVSIENARLYEKETKRISFERDLDTARDIQQSLLPKNLPSINGLDIFGEMIPAFQVGGDYFDVIKKSDKKIFIVIGDVSGKGLPASLHMTRLQAMMQTICERSDSPKDVLIEINRKLYNTLERNWFVTLSLALFDLDNKFIRFCRAGHTPLIVHENGIIQSVRPNGIGLGLEYGKIFEKSITEQIMPIKNFAHYLFFSDGVSEAMNPNDELFGEERLIEIVKKFNGDLAYNCVNNIISGVNLFRETKEQNDDISLVVVRTEDIN